MVTALEADASPASGCNEDDGTRLKRLSNSLEPDDPGSKTDARDIVHSVRVHPQSDGNKRVDETNAHRRKLESGGQLGEIVSPKTVPRDQSAGTVESDGVIDDGKGCWMDGAVCECCAFTRRFCGCVRCLVEYTRLAQSNFQEVEAVVLWKGKTCRQG